MPLAPGPFAFQGSANEVPDRVGNGSIGANHQIRQELWRRECGDARCSPDWRLQAEGFGCSSYVEGGHYAPFSPQRQSGPGERQRVTRAQACYEKSGPNAGSHSLFD